MNRRVLGWRLLTVAGLALATVAVVTALTSPPGQAPGGGHALGFAIGTLVAVWATAEAERAGRMK